MGDSQGTQGFNFTRKKKQIGSVDEVEDEMGRRKMIKSHFPKDQNFFHQADIPAHAQTAVRDMKDLTDPDILEMRYKPWNNSNKFEKGEEPLKENLFKVRHGLKDETIMPPKEPKIWEGTESRDIYYFKTNLVDEDGNPLFDNWKVSNQIPNPLEQNKKLAFDTAIVRNKTNNKIDKIANAR